MSNQPSILVTGASGQLGSEFQFLRNTVSNWHFEFISRNELNLEDSDSITKALEKYQPQVIINCAAYTKVEDAEDLIEPIEQVSNRMNYIVNVMAPRVMAEWCKANDSVLIHFSTDYVFDGKKNSPYQINDVANPINQYGLAKFLGEKAIFDSGASALIFRVSWLYGTFGHNFFKTMLRLADAQQELKVVGDQIASPTYSRRLAQDILKIVSNQKDLKSFAGLYHYSQKGEASWFDFAKKIMEFSQRDIPLQKVNSNAFPTKAKRPSYSKLNTEHTEQVFGLDFPSWEESLKDCIKDLTS